MPKINSGVKYPESKAFVISLIIYFFLLGLLFFKISQMNNVSESYTDDENSFVDLYVQDIDDSPVVKSPSQKVQQVEEKKIVNVKTENEEKTKTTIKQVEVPKEEVTPEQKVEKGNSKPIEEDNPEFKEEKDTTKNQDEKKETTEKINLTDIFSQTTKNNDKLQENLNKDNKIQSSKKSDKKTKTKESDVTAKQKGTEAGPDSGHSGKTGKYDKFLGGIERKLQNLWSVYVAKANNDAFVSITFGPNGKVTDYKILELSYDSDFNQKLRDFMSSLSMQDFPPPPDGQSYTIDKINLKDKLQ